MKIKSLLLSLAFIFSSTFLMNAEAQHSHKSSSGRAKTVHVRSYTKKNGTHVNAHYRSSPHRK